LVPFESEAELVSYFRQQVRASRMPRGGSLLDALGALFGALGAAPPLDDRAGGTGIEGEGTSYSGTNLQEAGVDESDTFKSDGEYFYIAKEQSLGIVCAYPTEGLAEVARVDLGFWVDSLYLFSDPEQELKTVIALGTQYEDVGGGFNGRPEILIWPPYYRGSKVAIAQIDVSDPENPTIIGQAELDGCLVSSRLTNGRLIVVLTILPQLPEGRPELLNTVTIDEVLPQMRVAGGAPVPLVPWQNWLHPEPPDGYAQTAVVTLDAADIETVVASVAVLAQAGTIYASPNALYLTDTEYDITRNFRETTSIHKFAFDEDGAARYAASGSVPGRLLNQFSLSEHEGYLRVATHRAGFGVVWAFDEEVLVGSETGQDEPSSDDGTEPDEGTEEPSEWEDPQNAVYVLAESEGELTIVGSLEGIAPNEDIYAARFLGTHGFLVTFRQIDPLHVLDLSDPANPRIVGELEVPGYSDYLHPLGQTHLIGVGRSVMTTEWGGVVPDAIQLSLFDVSDWEHPTLVQQVTFGGPGSYSEVSYTHKAFTLFEYNGQTLVAIPVEGPGLFAGEFGQVPLCFNPLGPLAEGIQPTCHFAGVVCYSVDPAVGFTYVGYLSSAPPWWPAWQRAAFIEDTLYALTPDGVRAAPVENLEASVSIELTD